MGITICDTHLTRTVRYLSLTFEPVYNKSSFPIHSFLQAACLHPTLPSQL